MKEFTVTSALTAQESIESALAACRFKYMYTDFMPSVVIDAIRQAKCGCDTEAWSNISLMQAGHDPDKVWVLTATTERSGLPIVLVIRHVRNFVSEEPAEEIVFGQVAGFSPESVD